MKRYLLFISLIISHLIILSGCEPDKITKPYKLRIYFADKVLETGKPTSQDIIKLFYPIEVNDTLTFNANDAVGKQSPLLIRLDNNYQESMAVELEEAVRSSATSLLIKERINAKFAGTAPYLVSKELGDSHRAINQSKIDSLLDSFTKKQGVFIYSANSEMSEYKGFKVIRNIDSLRYAIGQKLLENSSQEINVLYEVDLSGKVLEETPTSGLDSTQTPIDSTLGIDWAQYTQDSININRGGKPCRENFNMVLNNLKISYSLYLQEQSESIRKDIQQYQKLLSNIKTRCN